MRKYQFGDDNSSGFFNQLASMYAKQFQDPSFSSGGGEEDDSEYVLPEEVSGEPADYNSDGGDYEDLLSKYNDLQDQFNQFSAQSQMPNSTPYQDDSFLNFLFSKDDNNLPIDPEALNQPLSRGASGAASGINPNVLKTQQDVFTQFPGTKSLGIWGDQAHQQRASDHNTGDAEDFAFKSPTDAQSIVSKLQSEAAQRKIKYIIYNKKIWNPSISNEWRPYDGPNPHTDHIHVSYNRQYGGKYQTGGANQPIYTDNPNDPRLRAYRDSLTLYNRSQVDLNRYNNTKTALNFVLQDEPAVTAAYKRLGNPKPIQTVSKYLPNWTLSDQSKSMIAVNLFKKPVQPVSYNKSEPQAPYTKSIQTDSNIQSPSNLPPAPNIPNVGGPQQASNYSYQYRDDNGNQKVVYFPDMASWSKFTNSQPWASKSAEGNWASASGGIRFQTGGTNYWATNRPAYADSVLNAHKNLNWVQRLYQQNTPSIKLPGQLYPSTHLMADDGNGYVYPSIQMINGKLQFLGDRAEDYARQTNTGIQLPKQQGSWFAANGYKTAPGVLKNFKNGGVAWTAAQQYQGLNDAKYNKLFFPMDGWNTFRGLDNNQPVLIQDQLGKKQILKGKYDTASFYGQVRETRI